jgi:3',5'-cyclic AMP phosphodiesterase CpdA
VTPVTILHLSDLHFGRDADLAKIGAVERQAVDIAPSAIVLSGDLTQRARHGEFVAARQVIDRLAATAPVLVVPGNHDAQWFDSPYWVLGQERLFVKYRRWINADLTPVLEVPGAVIAGMLSAHGVCFPSMTWNLNDTAVKGHLPKSELERVAKVFAAVPEGIAKVVVLHHNVLRGNISQRMGLSRWKTAQERLAALRPDVILYGHDHEEAAAELAPGIVVSSASTLTRRTRGHRPSVFNVVTIEDRVTTVRFWRWNGLGFDPADEFRFTRSAIQASSHPAIRA